MKEFEDFLNRLDQHPHATRAFVILMFFNVVMFLFAGVVSVCVRSFGL